MKINFFFLPKQRMNKERSEIPSKAFQLSKACQSDGLLDRFVFYSALSVFSVGFSLSLSATNAAELPFALVISFCPDKRNANYAKKNTKLTVKLCNFTQNANGNS